MLTEEQIDANNIQRFKDEYSDHLTAYHNSLIALGYTNKELLPIYQKMLRKYNSLIFPLIIINVDVYDNNKYDNHQKIIQQYYLTNNNWKDVKVFLTNLHQNIIKQLENKENIKNSIGYKHFVLNLKYKNTIHDLYSTCKIYKVKTQKIIDCDKYKTHINDKDYDKIKLITSKEDNYILQQIQLFKPGQGQTSSNVSIEDTNENKKIYYSHLKKLYQHIIDRISNLIDEIYTYTNDNILQNTKSASENIPDEFTQIKYNHLIRLVNETYDKYKFIASIYSAYSNKKTTFDNLSLTIIKIFYIIKNE